ncbi:unnamed protein product [Tuber melanosporum]|uniref:(Perigord truffle) hypothetical protein n=1 Tax=Tuber melanosporum (strain Mel28) TaxID=656061 RepID=D5G4Z1_TUBMM|nr:uncharacterized protein GSTUM_00000165001 [Tuber melanosporum]CAZ79584.1 unnamed protein product [Tuber melanosporum]
MMLEFGSISSSSSSSNSDYSYGTVGVIAVCLLVVKEEDWYYRRGVDDSWILDGGIIRYAPDRCKYET